MEQSEQDDTISIKIPILHRTIPYVYIKASTVCNSYRLSGNYKYLNEHYNLKINFIRDLIKIDGNHWDNKYFSIDPFGNVTTKEKSLWQEWCLNAAQDNTLMIYRLIIKDEKGDSTLIILNREYKDEKNSSVFFASNCYYNINQFLSAQRTTEEGK
jgi:hypothetical protein